ncbi:MAG TPA: hypothetical protein DEQ40_02630 [Oxalobacteraceae bacterium]|jgi:hypothetical protein|nr:hypothetical protein [Oxalobacteraceae bacterium]
MTDKITKPGVYSISMEQYHSQCCIGPSVSSSGLRTIFTKSPAHFWVQSSLNPDAEEQKDTEAFVFGRAAHHLLLGEDDFSTMFIVRPDEAPDGRAWNGNNLTCKDWLAKQAKAGRTVLKPDQIEQIRGMARSLAAHPLIQAGILNGEIEKSLMFKDKETGIWLKARPDAIPNASGDFADLKTTSEIGFKLDRSVNSYRYDMQAALTKWGCKEVLGIDMTDFSFVFVEKEPPHCVDVLVLNPEDIQAAEHDLRASLHTLAYCLKTGDWFGPSGTQRDARYVSLGEFARNSALARREFLEREIKPAEIQPSERDHLAAG